MAWAKVDDRLFMHPKFVGLSFGARGLWVTALSWTCATGTDGVISRAALRSFTATLPRHSRSRWCNELVTSGLWSCDDSGYKFHDFLDYNFSAKALKSKREQQAQRMRDWRACDASRSAHVIDPRTRTRPVPLEEKRSGAFASQNGFRKNGMTNDAGFPLSGPPDAAATRRMLKERGL